MREGAGYNAHASYMLAKVFSGATVGLDGVQIVVEVDVASRGFPSFTIVGLPNKSIDESKERVRTAIINASLDMPEARITVNLAPADIPKEGSSFDLPIAVGILCAHHIVERKLLSNSLFAGELSLEGDVRGICAVVSLAMMAREVGIRNIFIPEANAQEAALVEGLTVYPVRSLQQLVLHMNGHKPIEPYIPPPQKTITRQQALSDFCHIQGQYQAKRAMEIAAAGFHNIHLRGVPGAGKTMLSRAFTTILPPLSNAEMLEVIRIYSLIGQTPAKDSMFDRPFRTPHHTTSRVGLIGGGTKLTPGEITLAHRGVLFLDEFPEFPRSVVESLRQPLEDGHITIARAVGSVKFPARTLLIAASNPCPCGYLGHPKKPCTCMPGMILKYRKRLSGPILDRIDLHVDVAPVDHDALTATKPDGEASETIYARVMSARALQQQRFEATRYVANSELSSHDVKRYCPLGPEANQMMKDAIGRLNMSARSYFKTLKVARTIADIDASQDITTAHIAESLQYRMKE